MKSYLLIICVRSSISASCSTNFRGMDNLRPQPRYPNWWSVRNTHFLLQIYIYKCIQAVNPRTIKNSLTISEAQTKKFSWNSLRILRIFSFWFPFFWTNQDCRASENISPFSYEKKTCAALGSVRYTLRLVTGQFEKMMIGKATGYVFPLYPPMR